MTENMLLDFAHTHTQMHRLCPLMNKLDTCARFRQYWDTF